MQRTEEGRIALKESVDKQYAEIQEQDSVGLEVWLKKNNFHVRGKSISFKLDVPFARDKEIKLIEKEDVVSYNKNLQKDLVRVKDKLKKYKKLFKICAAIACASFIFNIILLAL
jgi:hypothetical protein